MQKYLPVDDYERSQPSEKLASRRFGPLKISKLIGRNVVKFHLHNHLNIHPLVHVCHTRPYLYQPFDIGRPIFKIPDPVSRFGGEEDDVEKNLKYIPGGRGVPMGDFDEGYSYT